MPDPLNPPPGPPIPATDPNAPPMQPTAVLMPAVPQVSTPASANINTTTVAALGTAGGAEVILWGAEWIHTGQFIMTQDIALVIAAALAPFVHAIGRAILNRLNKIAGVPNA